MADNETPQPPAGWYPDPTQPGQQRYWDGAQWTEHTAPGGEAGGGADAGGTGPDAGGWDTGTGGAPPGGGFSAGGGGFDTGGFSGGTPGAYTSGATGERPDPWLWQSIVATLLCCLPAGIVGIVFAAKAQSAIGTGNYAEARDHAQKAKTWTLVSVGLGVALGLIWVLLIAVGGLGAGLDGGF